MLFVSIAVFLMHMKFGVSEEAIAAVEGIDMAILGGYYFFFGHGIYKAKHKLRYAKRHWIMVILLLLPFLPIARLARYAQLERVFAIGGNTLWHILDEVGLL